jgi:hypothetical protein
MKNKTRINALYTLLIAAFISTGLLLPKSSQAEDIWPWPLSVTCSLNVKNINGWWKSDSGPARYFKFESVMPIEGGKTLIVFSQYTASGNLVTHGHTLAGSNAKSLTFDVFERQQPAHKRVVYVHQIDMEKNCSLNKRQTVVSYVKLGANRSQDEAQVIFNLIRVDSPEFGRTLRP